jgi:uncharacterized protein (TIGR02246 family)
MTTRRAPTRPSRPRKAPTAKPRAAAPRRSGPADARKVRSLYQALLDAWNRQSARDMAALFARDANLVGFDGSPINGRAQIASQLGPIFASHRTAAYVAKVRNVRFLTPDVAVLRAVAGMVPPGQSDIHPPVNAVQTLVATKDSGEWRIAVYQNTPAAFHGRPELSEQLTEELRQVLRQRS